MAAGIVPNIDEYLLRAKKKTHNYNESLLISDVI